MSDPAPHEGIFAELEAANRRHAAAFDAGGSPAAPSRGLAVLTCMDVRVDPLRLLGLGTGEAHIIRNAGGRASDDALRSLIVSTQLLGARALLVIHHTDCGMLGRSNAELRERVTRQAGADASGLDFLPFDDEDEGVREDLRRVRGSPLLPAGMAVAGYVYDVDSGALRRVPDDPAAPAAGR